MDTVWAESRKVFERDQELWWVVRLARQRDEDFQQAGENRVSHGKDVCSGLWNPPNPLKGTGSGREDEARPGREQTGLFSQHTP